MSLQAAHGAAAAVDLGHASRELVGHGGAGGDGRATHAQLFQGADEQPPFRALDDRDVGRVGAIDDLRLIDPDEVGAGEVAVTDLELDARGDVASRGALALRDTPGHGRAVGEPEPDHCRRIEEPERVHDDDRDHARDHQQRERERGGREPDERFAAAPELLHR
jgi:hypothetical protein